MFSTILLLMFVAGLLIGLLRQRPPLRNIDRNIVYNSLGEAWAGYRLPTESWRHAPEAERDQYGGRIAGVAETLERDFRILRIHRGFDAETHGKHMGALCDPDTGDKEAWDKRTSQHVELLQFRETFKPEVYLMVRLGKPVAWSVTGQMEELSTALGKAWQRAHSLFRPTFVPAKDTETKNDEETVLRRIRRLGGDRASTSELEFLIRRNAMRGLSEPQCDEFWVSEAMQLEGDIEFEARELSCLRLLDCDVKNLRETTGVRVKSEAGTSYQTTFALGAIPALNLDDSDLLSGWLDEVPFPVDMVFDAKFRRNQDAQRQVQAKAKKVSGMWEEEHESNALGTSAKTDELPGLAQRLKGYLDDHTKPPLLEATILFPIGARSIEELKERADTFLEAFTPIKLDRPVHQIAAHTAALPGGPFATKGYEAPFKVEQLAYLAPTASNEAGSHQGVYIGYTRTRAALPILFDLVEGPATNETPTIFLLGEQGGGKTVFMQYLELLAYEIGSKIVDIDPKTQDDGEADHKLFEVPSVNKDDFEVIEFSPESMKMRRGMLDPLRIAPDELKESAAVSFYTSLLGEQAERTETRLRQAIQQVLGEGEGYATGHRVIETLRAADDPSNQELGEDLAVRANSELPAIGFAHQGDEIFEAGTKQVVTFRLRNLPIPSPDVPVQNWDAEDREGEALLKLVMTYGLRLTAGASSLHKVFGCDEFHAFDAAASSGYKLMQRINRLARSKNITPILASQRASDVERLRGLIGCMFIFKLKDEELIENAIKLLGRDPDNEKLKTTIRKELGGGAAVIKGYDDRMAEMQIDLVDEGLLKVLGTTPGAGSRLRAG